VDLTYPPFALKQGFSLSDPKTTKSMYHMRALFTLLGLTL
jgi:hypothetical protein